MSAEPSHAAPDARRVAAARIHAVALLVVGVLFAAPIVSVLRDNGGDGMFAVLGVIVIALLFAAYVAMAMAMYFAFGRTPRRTLAIHAVALVGTFLLGLAVLKGK